mgnify:CR=1 FL=1
MAIILGIDPGSRVTGFGLIDTQNNTPRAIDYGCIRMPTGELTERNNAGSHPLLHSRRLCRPPFCLSPRSSPPPCLPLLGREGVLRPETSGRLSQASGAPPEEVAMVATKMLNRVITKYSEGSSLVMPNLPMPTIESGQTPAAYMRIIDALTEDIPLCILVAGQKDANVVTMYS